MQTARAAHNRSRAGTKSLFHLLRRSTPGGRETKKKPAQQGSSHGKEQHMPIELHLFSARQRAGPEGQKRTNAKRCEQNAERTSGKPQYGAFGEALAHQSAAGRSERDTHGQFALAGNGAARSKLATLAHAISSTKVTAPRSSHS